MKQSVNVMHDAFADFYNNKTLAPLRTITEFDQSALTVFYKPSCLLDSDTVGIKLLAQTQKESGTPTIQGLNLLVDGKTGSFFAILDGAYLTALRTGATSGLATDFFARKNAKTAAIFGAGAQGHTQLEGVCAVRAIERAYIYDINKEAVNTYIEEMQPYLDIELLVGKNTVQLQEVDIICTATASTKPLFSLTDLKEGVHINAIGSYKSTMQEIDPNIITSARVYVDQKDACLAETGDFLKPMNEGIMNADHIFAEIGEVIAGKKGGRHNDKEITLFKSVGIAIQDLAISKAAYHAAVKQNTATFVDI